jgi:phenylalanyl-tRNA synthetase beta subunit
MIKDALRFVVNSLLFKHKFQYKIGELTTNRRASLTVLFSNLCFRSMERNLLNSEIDELQFKLRDIVVDKLKVELR